MIRERMRHRKNLFQRMLSIMLVLALAAVSALGTGRGIRAESGDSTTVYLDGVSGDDSQDGKSRDEAVATFSKAKKLVGDKGTIRVCGTVTVSGSESWSLGSGVRLKKASGFTDAVAHVTGSLKLSGITLYNTDISGSGSVSGLAGRSPASEISVPSAITLVQPKALSEVSLSDQCFGTGSFVWADGSFVPDRYETQAQIIFTPSDVDVHDYSGLKGWNGDSQTVIRTVKILTQSFLEEEKKEDGSDDAKAEEDSENKDKAGTDGQTENAGKDEDGDRKPEDGSGKEDGKADDGSGDTAQSPEDGKTDSDSGEEGQKPEDEKNDDGSGKENQSPEDGKADGDSDKADQSPEEGKTDNGSDKADQNPEDGKTDSEPGMTDQSPEDGKTDAPDGAEPEKPGEEQNPEDGEAPDGAEKPADGTDGEAPEENPGAEEKKDDPTETWDAKKVEELLAKLPESIGSQSDVETVVRASVAYEQLDEDVQAEISGELRERLYDAQSRVLGYNRVSLGVTVQGDLPWYIQFRATAVEGRKIDDTTIRTLLDSYEFELWNLITDSEYKLNGRTVTVLMAAPAVRDMDIVIYHYLEDGTVEQIIPEITGDQMSFVTSSFSPFSVIGVNVAGSTELVGSTGFSYVDTDPGSSTGGSKSGNGGTGNNSTGNSGTGSNRNNGTGSSSTGSNSTGSGSGRNGSSSSAQSSSASGSRTTGNSSSASVRRASAVGTGDTNNLLGYAMVGSGAVMLMLFAAYMVYVQYKRKSYSRRS
ncbi:MAG TPA: hypothetical protein DF613_06040 [Lachnospiraceae bacterium]|nr:hypothetical protein [Lachnospiraceae bacterium]